MSNFAPCGLYNFAFPPEMHYSTCFPTVLSKETMDFANLIGRMWFLKICNSIIVSEVDHCFLCLKASLINFSMAYLFIFFAFFVCVAGFFFSSQFLEVLHVLRILALYYKLPKMLYLMCYLSLDFANGVSCHSKVFMVILSDLLIFQVASGFWITCVT